MKQAEIPIKTKIKNSYSKEHTCFTVDGKERKKLLLFTKGLDPEYFMARCRVCGIVIEKNF